MSAEPLEKSSSIDSLFDDFNKRKNDLETSINSIKFKSQIVPAKAKVNQLSDLIQTNNSKITQHDLKYYTSEINSLNELLEKRQASFQSKFSFKNRNLKRISESSAKEANSQHTDGAKSHEAPNTTALEELQNKNQIFYSDSNQQYLDVSSGSSSQHHLFFQNIKNSVIRISGARESSVHFENCSNVVVWADIDGPVMMHKMSKFMLCGACHQLRIHQATGGKISINVASKEAAIEDSQELVFHPLENGTEPPKINDFSNPSRGAVSLHYTEAVQAIESGWLRTGDERAIRQKLTELSEHPEK